MVGIVTALEGEPLPSGDIASRLGGFDDVAQHGAGAEATRRTPRSSRCCSAARTTLHNNYQDFQAFLDAGGKIGLQHDPLLYGAYLLNPFLVRVEMVPMLVVNQGEVAVIKAYVGLPTLDTSGAEFKFGSIVRPGHRGIWQEPLRTGKYPINPRVLRGGDRADVDPHAQLGRRRVDRRTTSTRTSRRSRRKSREGFVFRIDLQVQIHVPDTRAPKVISMVGTMQNLVNEVLQAAVGNHFRNTLQGLRSGARSSRPARRCRRAAFEAITAYLSAYEVETQGRLHPGRRVPRRSSSTVLTQREIANQEKATFEEQQRARDRRASRWRRRRAPPTCRRSSRRRRSASRSRPTRPQAREAEARGEAAYVELTGRGGGDEGRGDRSRRGEGDRGARARRARPGSRRRRKRSARAATALVAVANAVADGHITVVPEVLVTGGGGGAFDGLAATLMRTFGNGSGGNGRGGNGGGKPAIVVPEPGGTVVADAEPGETVVDQGEPEARS